MAYLQHINYNMSLIDSFLNLLAPYECLGCGKEGILLCADCSYLLAPAGYITEVSEHLERISFASLYEGAAKALVWQLKSGGAQAAAKIMASCMAPLVQNKKDFCIVPVPTATSRVRQRGYDQSRLIARALAGQTGFKYFNCLAREGQSHQVGASRQVRLSQLRNSFRVKGPVKHVNIILIDDVVTTGATFESAATTLKSAGANKVLGLAFVNKPKNVL